MQKLINQIERWAEDRDLITGSTPENQKLKLLEEVGELSEGINRKNIELIKDGIGDCFIVCVVLAKQSGQSLSSLSFNKEMFNGFKFNTYYLSEGLADVIALNTAPTKRRFLRLIGVLNALCVYYRLTLEECVQYAYNQIKDRKGKMIDGVFVKEEDLRNGE